MWDRLKAAARLNPKLSNDHGNYETRPQRRFITTGWFWQHYAPPRKQHQRAGQYVESPAGYVRSAEASDMLRMWRTPSGQRWTVKGQVQLPERPNGGTERMSTTPPETVIEVASHALFATAFGLLTNADRCLKEAQRRYSEDQIFIGQCLRMEREGRKVSLRALAKQMKLSAPYVSDLELGRRNWSQVTMANYGHALDSLANAAPTRPGQPESGHPET